MYYGINSDLSLCGPFDSAMSATDDVIHLRTHEEWVGLFDVVEEVAAKNPEAPGYYSINGMRIFFLGHHSDAESAQLACAEVDKVVERQIRNTHTQMEQSGTDDLLLGSVEELVASIPPGKVFNAQNVPAWREQLEALIPNE